jgi:hypothetical protein
MASVTGRDPYCLVNPREIVVHIVGVPRLPRGSRSSAGDTYSGVILSLRLRQAANPTASPKGAGERLLRIAPSNWSTTEDDVDRRVHAIVRARTAVLA